MWLPWRKSQVDFQNIHHIQQSLSLWRKNVKLWGYNAANSSTLWGKHVQVLLSQGLWAKLWDISLTLFTFSLSNFWTWLCYSWFSFITNTKVRKKREGKSATTNGTWMDGWMEEQLIDFEIEAITISYLLLKGPNVSWLLPNHIKGQVWRKGKKQVFSPFLPFSGSLVRNKRGDEINDGEFESVSARWSLSVNCSSPLVGSCHLLATQCVCLPVRTVCGDV